MSDVFESESNHISFNLIRNEIKRMYNRIKSDSKVMCIYVHITLYKSSIELYRDSIESAPFESVSIDSHIDGLYEELLSIQRFDGGDSYYLLDISVRGWGATLKFKRSISFPLTEDFLRKE